MEYVYHNHIDLVQSQILKLKEKDSKKHFKFLDKSQQIKCFPDLIGDYCNNISGVAVLNLSEKSIYARYLFDLLTSEYISLHSLRGPPIT